MSHGTQRNIALQPKGTPTREDIIFAAGFYEGEGCVCVVNKKRVNGKAIAVVIGQKDPEILYRLRDLFGGGVYIRKNSGANKIKLHAWVMSGYLAKPFLRQVFQYLSTRRKEQIERICPDLFSESVETERLPSSKESDVPVRSAQECVEDGRNDRPRVN